MVIIIFLNELLIFLNGLIITFAYKNKTKELMKELVSLSAKHSSLDKAVKKLNEKYGANKVLKIRQKFNELNISPVVIPRRAQYKRLPGTDTLIGHFYNKTW